MISGVLASAEYFGRTACRLPAAFGVWQAPSRIADKAHRLTDGRKGGFECGVRNTEFPRNGVRNKTG